MRCREYDQFSVLCNSCDIKSKVTCSKKFNFDEPKKYVEIRRRDSSFSWNICPTCGCSIGYHPKDTKFKCPKCKQRILWE